MAQLVDFKFLDIFGPVLYDRLRALRTASEERADQSEDVSIQDIVMIVVADYFGLRMRPAEGPGLTEPRVKGQLPRFAFDWLSKQKVRMEAARDAYDDNPDITVDALRRILSCERGAALAYHRMLNIETMLRQMDD
jgi:hypothetical protein